MIDTGWKICLSAAEFTVDVDSCGCVCGVVEKGGGGRGEGMFVCLFVLYLTSNYCNN